MTVAGLRGVAATTKVVVKVLAGNVLTARTVVGMAVGTAVGMAVKTIVGMAVGTAVGMAVGTVVGMVVKNDAQTVRGIVVVVIRRPGDALAVRTVIEKAVRIRDGIGSRDIAVGVLLIIILVTPIIHHAVPRTGQRIAMTSAVRAEVHMGRAAAQGVAHRKPPQDKQKDSGSATCFRCGERGHLSYDCAQPRSDGRQRLRQLEAEAREPQETQIPRDDQSLNPAFVFPPPEPIKKIQG